MASLPRDIGWLHILGTVLLCCIGFTRAIFVTGLAFVDDTLVLQSKFAILIASLATDVLGYLVLRFDSEIQNRLE